MAKAYVGVDIGSTAVRAARVENVDDSGFAVISRFAIAPLRGDAMLGGKIRNPQAVAQALAKVTRAVGARPATVVLGASVPEAAVSRVALPAAVKPGERLGAIRTLGVQIAPSIPLSDASLSANFVREERTTDGRSVAALVVAATSQSEVDALMTVASLAGIEPRAIDLAAAGTMRALVRDIPNSRDTATIVDVGATRTNVVTREGLIIRSVRTFVTGGLDLTRALASAQRETFEDAERRKYSMRLPVGTVSQITFEKGYGDFETEDDEYQRRLASQNTAEQALANAAEGLIDQIAQAVELDASNQGVLSRHLALCGGTALMRGLKERLQRRLNVEVRIGHPWARLDRTKENAPHFINGREDPRLMLSLATACGLALWRPSDG